MTHRFQSVSSLILLCLLLAFTAFPAAAQTSPQATATPSGPANATNATVVICERQAIVNLSGVSLVGWDVFYQIFAGAGTGGTPLTGVRQVPTAGEYSVSETVTYTSGTVPAGAIATVRIFVARETNSARIDYEFTVTDVQDGCAAPQFTPVTSTDSTSDGAQAGQTGSRYGINRSILAPNGTLLNPNLAPEAQVVIGARPSDRFRSSTPGLIFAECDAFPLAIPGLVYDNDSVTVFWSWFTRTAAQMEQHLANANYTVTLNTAALQNVQRSEPVRREGNFWVFYTATVGNLRPGHYEVGYGLTWANAVNDGYNDYGPGTANPLERGICNFDVLPNPNGVTGISYNLMYFPTTGPVHDINRDN
jgi:hypothetical protein